MWHKKGQNRDGYKHVEESIFLCVHVKLSGTCGCKYSYKEIRGKMQMQGDFLFCCTFVVTKLKCP